eukprot:124932-Rhodomonas_salina.1
MQGDGEHGGAKLVGLQVLDRDILQAMSQWRRVQREGERGVRHARRAASTAQPPTLLLTDPRLHRRKGAGGSRRELGKQFGGTEDGASGVTLSARHQCEAACRLLRLC